MKRKLMEQALDGLDPKYIAEAERPRRRKGIVWLSAVAAVLTVAILGGLLLRPGTTPAVQGTLVAAASPSRQMSRPDMDSYTDRDAYREAAAKWLAEGDARSATVDSALTSLAPFFKESAARFLADSGDNQAFCPLNTYLALAMLAEVTGSTNREQILSVLNTPDTKTLRDQVHAIWEAAYWNSENGKELCVSANSLWLDSSMLYRREAVENLAYHYYASVYCQDLRSPQAAKDLRAWIDSNTGNRLKNYSAKLELPEETALVLASTVNFRSKWAQYTEFSPRNNTTATFHSPRGDYSCTFMNKKEMQTHYYWGESFGAVAMYTENGCRMWFILPDADKTVNDVLTQGEYMSLVLERESENSKYMKVNFTVPKFDIGSSGDLSQGLRDMGITEVFSEDSADFSPILATPEGAYLGSVQQATRVAIDEDGVTAASYIVLPAAGAAMPPEEIIDFVLDRPFLFVIADSTGIPLFSGVVNQP